MNKKCIGCGSILQTQDATKDGYVIDLNKDLCYRCFRLKHYNDFNHTSSNNNDYQKILSIISDNDLVVYVTSILNLNLDHIKDFKNCLLVITKRDILPKSLIDAKLIKNIQDNYINIQDVFIISSLHNYNLDMLYQKLITTNFSNIYFVGNTNSGKSTLLNKLIKNYTDLTSDITTSMYPETTINILSFKIGTHNFIDTPGLVNPGSITNYITPKIIKQINPQKEIKPIVYQLHGTGSLLINNLVRIDYNTKNTSMISYLNNGLPIKKINPHRSDFHNNNPKKFTNLKNKDLVIEDLCFIRFTNSIDLTIYTIDGVSITTRKSLIC